MNIGWILLIVAISIAALYVILRPKRTNDNVTGKTVVLHGKPARSESRAVGAITRGDEVDTSITDALVLSTILSDNEPYEPELPQPSPEPEYVPAPTPEPQPYCPPEPDTYKGSDSAPSYDSTPSYDSSCDSTPSYSD